MKKLIVAQAERVINQTRLHYSRSQPMPKEYSKHFAHAEPTRTPSSIQHAFVNAVVKANHRHQGKQECARRIRQSGRSI